MLLVVIHEKFFKGDGSLEGHKCHEIVFCFLMKPRGIMTLESNSYTQGVKEEMHWIPISEIEKYRAYPSFLKDNIDKLNSGILNIVTDERNDAGIL